MMEVFAVVAIGAAVAGFVQGLSGFAFSLIALSFWAWVLEPRLAAMLAIFGALTGQIIAAVTIRRGFNLSVLLPFLLGGLAGVPIGVALLPHLDASMFKALLGLLLVIWCPIMLFARDLPRVAAGGRGADAASGLAGGILGGLGGLTGAIPTLWCTLKQLDKDTQRSVIQNFNLVTLTVSMLAYVINGAVTKALWPMLAVVAPAMLIPTLIGGRIYLGISEATFRRVVLTALTAAGIALLASSVPKLLA